MTFKRHQYIKHHLMFQYSPKKMGRISNYMICKNCRLMYVPSIAIKNPELMSKLNGECSMRFTK